jgi:hypothetical protein
VRIKAFQRKGSQCTIFQRHICGSWSLLREERMTCGREDLKALGSVLPVITENSSKQLRLQCKLKIGSLRNEERVLSRGEITMFCAMS